MQPARHELYVYGRTYNHHFRLSSLLRQTRGQAGRSLNFGDQETAKRPLCPRFFLFPGFVLEQLPERHFLGNDLTVRPSTFFL